MTIKTLFPGMILALALASCSGDDGGGQPPTGDGGTPPGKEAGTVWPDQGAPQGCEQQCLDEQPYYCVTKTSSTGSDSCVQCLEDKHCQGNPYAFGPTCDTTLNKCECANDGECATNKNGKKCHESLNRCYCETDAECTPPLRCVGKYISTSICALPCKIDADCNDPEKPYCDAGSGQCVACSNPTHCKDSPDGTLCVDNKCTCATDADCQGDYPWGNKCNTTSKRCGCDTDAECAGNSNGPKCKTTYNKCTCDSDADCTKAPYTKCTEPYSYASYKHCQKPCATDADCADKGSLKACDVATGTCVACLKDADCTSTYSPVCDVAQKKCVACRNDSHCTGTKPYCDVANSKCVECKSNADCANNPDGTLCDGGSCGCKVDGECKAGYPWGGKCITSYGRCGCEADGDCGGNPNGPTCYTTYKKCTCTGDAQCTKAPYTKCAAPYSSASYTHCQKPCASDADCADLVGLNTCNVGSGKCVECMGDGDCTSTTYKYCLGATGQCVQCRSDADCTSSYAPACKVATGKCVECKTDAHCATSKDGKHCDVASNQCTCQSNADCAANQFTKVCDTSSGCEECKVDTDCGVNSLGNKCSGTICVCAADADCANHNVGHKCDTSMQACYCVTDADCPAGKTCSGQYIGIDICQ